MCGFFISNDPLIDSSSLSDIESSLRFRGPDASSGLIFHNGWNAYHARLSIIDIESGVNQPVIDLYGGLLVFNGEILNYKELGFKYFNKEYKSDSLLLSDLLSQRKMIESELDGFFAFVYIDKDGVLKNACRDKFGVKPLYYYSNGNSISFSSEPSALKKIFKLGVNSDAIEEYFSTRAPIFSGSYFTGVNTIEPGCCLIKGRYFDCQDYLGVGYERITVDQLEAGLKLGIKTRMVSDAPVGLLLSRGVDSNIIKELGDFERYYSIGFSGDEDIEYLKSKKIDNLTIVECTDREYLEDFKYLLNLRCEPMSVPNEVLLYRVSKVAAKDGIKVLLSGEGADEFFGGYDRIFNWAASKKEFNLDEFISLYCYQAPEKNTVLYDSFKTVFKGVKNKTVFEKVRWFFIRFHMPVLFRRLDFALMAAGVEGREPIANDHIFRLAVKFSELSLMQDDLGKKPLRDIIGKYLGYEFAFEKKVGFPVDLTKIFENPNALSSYELWFKENLKVLK